MVKMRGSGNDNENAGKKETHGKSRKIHETFRETYVFAVLSPCFLVCCGRGTTYIVLTELCSALANGPRENHCGQNCPFVVSRQSLPNITGLQRPIMDCKFHIVAEKETNRNVHRDDRMALMMAKDCVFGLSRAHTRMPSQ